MSRVFQRPPCYELFFAALAVVLSPGEYERIQFAYFISKYGHAKQFRDDGTRYFDHPKAATWIYIDELGGRDVRIIIDTLLHDVQEDTYLLSSYRSSLNFGPNVALDLRSLTKLPKGKETTESYLGRITARGPWPIVAKLCDRLHNLRTMSARSPGKIQSQIEETERFHIPLLLGALKSCGEEWLGIASQLEQKIAEAVEQLRG